MRQTPLTPEQRRAVVLEAFSWVGTPYHHCADVKGHGVDCAMILVSIYTSLGITEPFDPRPYSPQWFLHRSEEIYLEWIKRYCKPTQKAQPGDIALYRFGRCAAHGAIVVDDNLMIHAYAPVGRVQTLERRVHLPHGKLDSLWEPMVTTL